MSIDSETIKEELAKAGIAVNSIYDLVNTTKPYPEVIPILTDFLRRGISDNKTKEGVIRALTVKEAKGKVGEPLINEFYKTSEEDSEVRWVIGNALTIVATENELEDIIKIVENKDYGSSRQMFAMALGKIKSERSEEVLIKHLRENDLPGHVIWALGNLKSEKAEKYLRPFLNDPQIWIRKEAEKALKKIAKSKEKRRNKRC